MCPDSHGFATIGPNRPASDSACTQTPMELRIFSHQKYDARRAIAALALGPLLLSRPALAQFSVVLGRTELPGHSAPKSGGLFPEQRWILQLSIAVDLRCVPDLLKTNRQRAPRQMWNDVERPLHVLANLVIAVGFVPGFLDGEWSGAPAAVRHDRVRAHESAARGRVDGVSLGHAQGKQKRTSCRER